ncbi:zinc finger protein 160-like isoform X2 [Palaemon carinicauda]|uniref:zinc finger protein 160-like isoform X2 n=1 Tax=Palaemon carinicauda TaxID=392227 RepID=UPI0035B6365A
MDSDGKRSLKRKANDYQGVVIGGRVPKEAKRDISCTGDSSSVLALRRLVPEDWSSLPIIIKEEEEEEEDALTKTRGQVVDRGTDWSGDVFQEPQGISSQLYVACNRSANRSSSFDCETQTYYFVENAQVGREESSKDKGLVRKCCVIGCKHQSEEDSSISYYDLPSSKAERSTWANILGLNFAIDPGNETHEICSKHFDASVGPQNSLLKAAQAPKSKTRKKKTCDILIAEEAEKVKQSMATGRTKRTLKPNRNYDWAELIPLMKNETPDIEAETATPKTSRNSVGPGRPRKQPLDDVKRSKKENEKPLREMRVNLDNEIEVPNFEEDEYEIEIGSISLPSAPRAPPPKPKGRPHRIQDTCTQTDQGLWSMKSPLREVKVQCNLTAEPLLSCSSCSSIDWRSLDEELFRLLSVIEYDIINPILSRCLSNVLSQNKKPSHAGNVLKMIAGLPRDVLECIKDIDIVPGGDELEEVEVEKFIHQEDAPVEGVREITAKEWNKKVETVREVFSKPNKGVVDDQDSFGLKEATEKDDEEFNPDYSMLEEEEEDEESDNEDDDDDDDDWDIKNEDESGAPIQRKKKKRHKAKKEYTLKAGLEQGSSNAVDKEETLDSSAGNKTNRKRLRNEHDTRWIRQEHRCSECNIVFSTRRKYELHYSHIHLGVAPWQGSHQCEDCGKVFTQKITLKVHRMFKHGAPRRFRCTKCTYVAPTKEYLKRHMRVHSDEKQFVCRECGKGLKTVESYKNHMVLHTNEGRFFCDTCQKAFNHKGAYFDHMHSHQEKRNFACYCGASFKVYKHVARHIRAVHLNDKRFICDICGTQHMTGFNLKNHLKKHSDMPYLPYSYQCTGCEAKFRGHQGLETHVKLVHNLKSLEDAVEEASDKQLVNPHPTRRPTKYHFSSISEDVSNESVEANKKSQESSIHVSCEEDYVLTDMKSGDQEEVVYNVSERELDLNCDVSQDFIVASNDEREVIHIYSCNTCSAIFASESQCQEHMIKAHS